ncbi:hypothetical protein BGZ58_001169 [Dissophora ornata]|nr:hypothetical protein BGZ58_001169 [Dissophora ornata]
MGSIGVGGNISYLTTDTGCMLYMTVDNKVPLYHASYCQFPVIGAAVISVFAVLFLGYWAAVAHRYDEYAPVIVSQIFMVIAIMMTVLSFAICGEIGIGLSIGCQSIAPGGGMSGCQTATSGFQALYTGQVSAGLMGGFWIVAIVLEYVQFKYQPEYDADPYNTQQQAYGQNNESTTATDYVN